MCTLDLYGRICFPLTRILVDNAKNRRDKADPRLIASLKDLNQQTNLEEVVNVDESYVTLWSIFVATLTAIPGSHDSTTIILYKKDGQLSMIPGIIT